MKTNLTEEVVKVSFFLILDIDLYTMFCWESPVLKWHVEWVLQKNIFGTSSNFIDFTGCA